MHIFHISEKIQWEAAKGAFEYHGDTLVKDGFIHCCSFEQLEGVLEKWFAGKHDLVLVEIDPDKIISSIKFENLEGGEELFPHIYGPINLAAVISEKEIESKEVVLEPKIKNIEFSDLNINVFDLWDKTWLLLTSGDYSENKFNAMTVAWGSFGNMWNLPFAMVVVRPTRYTFEFINTYPSFTLCAFPEDHRKALNLLGTKSGRDCNKIKDAGITPMKSEKVEAPSYEEADLVIECRKLYFDDFEPKHFLDNRIDKQYPLNDYHQMIFGEILTVRGIPKKYT